MGARYAPGDQLSLARLPWWAQTMEGGVGNQLSEGGNIFLHGHFDVVLPEQYTDGLGVSGSAR